MHRTLHAAMAADMAGVLVVLESYFYKLRHADSIEEINEIARDAHEEILGQRAGSLENHLLKPI